MQREVVRWLQSLDLSFPVKNPKRDLTNGFTVAEILSRYDKEVAMHSFDTGMAMTRRIDNWHQIQKILQRMECATIGKEAVEGTMQAKGDAALKLLEELYMFLTKRPLRENVIAPVRPTALDMPGYARPTAAIVLREANDPSAQRLQQATGQIDAEKLRSKNELLLQQHTAVLQTLKVAEPERYVPEVPQVKAKSGQKNAEGGDGGQPVPRIAKTKLVTERQVASVPATVLTQFAQREAAVKEEALRQGFPPLEDLSTALSRVMSRTVKDYGLEELLDSASDSQTAAEGGGAADGGSFLAKFIAVRSAVPADAKNAIWTVLLSSAKNIAKHLKVRPREVHHLFVALSYCFTKEASKLRGIQLCATGDGATTFVHKYPTASAAGVSPQLDATLDVSNGLQLLVAVGKECCGLSTELTGTLLEQFIIPRVALVVVTATTAFAHAIATVLSAFVHATHSEGLQQLLSLLDSAVKPVNPEKFFVCVSAIFDNVVFAECPGSPAVCLYYAIAALNSESGMVQGFGLLFLRRLVDTSDEVALVEREIAQVKTLAVSAQSWEVRLAGLDLLLAFWQYVTVTNKKFRTLAEPPHAAEDGEDGDSDMPSPDTLAARRMLAQADATLPSILDAFDSFELSPISQRKLALATVTKYRLDCLPEQITTIFFARIAQFSNADRSSFFCYDEAFGAPVEGIEGKLRAVYPVGGVFSSWNGDAVVNAIANDARNETMPAMKPLPVNLYLDLELRALQCVLNADQRPAVAVHESKRLVLSRVADLGHVGFTQMLIMSNLNPSDIADEDVVVLELAKQVILGLFQLSDAYSAAVAEAEEHEDAASGEDVILTAATTWLGAIISDEEF